MASTAEIALDRFSFRGTWRHYQELALEAFDRDIGQGRWRTHIVARRARARLFSGSKWSAASEIRPSF
jgi:hypothetical protein